MNKKEYKRVEDTFNEFYKAYEGLSKSSTLKYRHSYNVADLMWDLADRLNMKEGEKYLAKAIGLLHDLGRFEQLKQYNSFNDANMDHADYAVTYLFELGHIREFIEDDKYDSIIKESIYNHNKFEIREGLTKEELKYSKMIRDMDKTDILYQVSVNYDLQFVEKPSEGVVETFKKGESIRNSMKKNKSDSIVMTFAFFNDIYFKDTYEILKENDNFGLYVSSIEVSKENEELFKELVNRCYEQIDGEVVKC